MQFCLHESFSVIMIRAVKSSKQQAFIRLRLLPLNSSVMPHEPTLKLGEIGTMNLLGILLTLLLLPLDIVAQQEPPPIIDMHLHAKAADEFGPPPRILCLPITVHSFPNPQCSEPIRSPLTDEAMIEQTVAIVERHNIIGVLSGYNLKLVSRFQKAAPERFIPAYEFNLDRKDILSSNALRLQIKAGAVKVLGEITNQYVGISPGDKRMEPYWALAEELDVPVAVHMGEGYPGAPYLNDPKYRAQLGSPFLLEDVLVRHPKLRVYVMHYGSPLIQEMISVMYTHPQVYVDLGGIQWTYPREYFYLQLKQFIDAGFGNRVMFGSDQMVWPDLIQYSIDIIEEAPFLSEMQKRDILYNNAACFLRLSEQEIAKHHGR
jgi:predicted TIM-barrel fold metal-dependent hydrolase